MKRPNKTVAKSEQTRSYKKTIKPCVSRKAPERNHIVDSPKPGPSHITEIPDTSSDDDDDDDGDATCCVFDRFQTEEQEACVSLTFVKWARCDGIRNESPCWHWTHLGFCTPVKEAFYKYMIMNCIINKVFV
ncbi:hypothetical protein DPMN_039849 [Dreissena polymorpha]|uniref:Uncharacterized protein n=1 Tax=Dreissena polymorpha TaxID=45954 RepID=A0A9D4CVQ8_DREPO|nr:hypothetical protein DPMN_039849 [Dreissena polymorpha]